MTDEASFLAAIAENPKDQNLPLIFADWLDDRGDPRGQWIRNWSVRHWMGPKLENPIARLLDALTKDQHVMSVRYAAEVIGEPMVPGLVKLLKHVWPRVRLQACHCLRKIGPRARAAVPALMAALADDDYSVREQAAKALAEIGTDEPVGTDQLKAALTDKNWNVRRAASKVLGVMGAKESVLDELVARFTSADPNERAEVVEGLAQLGTADVIPHLDRALDDPVPAVRLAAVRALGGLKLPAADAPLCRAMQAADASVRESAARFSGHARNVPYTPDVIGALTALLSDRANAVRATACDALRQAETRARSAVPALLANLEHDSPDVRAQAARALAAVTRDDPAVVAALTALVSDPELSVAAGAVGALAEQTRLPGAVVAPLFAFIRRVRGDEGTEFHAAAAYRAFGRLAPPPPEVIDELRRALGPPQSHHRQDLSPEAADALAALGPAAAPAVPELLAAIRANRLGESAVAALLKIGGAGLDGLVALFDSADDEDAWNRARTLLWRVGPAGAPLVPVILRCLRRNPDDWRRSHLVDCIRSIGPSAAVAVTDLIELAAGPGVRTPQSALAALRTFGAALVPHLPRLAELARTPGAERHAFAELFAELAEYTPDVVEPLRERLRAAAPAEGDNWSTQWANKNTREAVLRGFITLGRAAGPALPDVAPLVADPDVAVRRLAVNVLCALDTPAACGPLCRALADTDDVVRVRAAEALAGPGDTSDETVAALVHAVGDREAKVRRAAIDTLNKLKVATDAVRAALAEAVRDDDKKVAERAGVALRKIAPKGKTERAEPSGPKADAAKAKPKKKAKGN